MFFRTMMRRQGSFLSWPIGPALLLPALAATLAACGSDTSRTDGSQARQRVEAASAPAGLSHAARRARLEQGKKLYQAECSACHGERGRGDGPAAEAMAARPRDFTREPFRYRTTASGDPPRRQDVLLTIERGMPGTAMPPFRFLSQEERELLTDFVLYLADLDPTAEPPVLELIPETPRTADSLEKGKALYARLGCDKCHGPEGAGDGPSGKTLKDSLGHPLPPRDLKREKLRRGETLAEVVHALQTGLDGTPMPSFTDGLSNDQVWDLARYVQSLQEPDPPLPQDLVARGRQVVERYHCSACHTIEGRGGRVGPSLDVSAKKLRQTWVQGFLGDPRAFGKIYPFTSWRMPDLGLEPEEIAGVLALFGQISGRGYPEPADPVPAVVQDTSDKGMLLYFLKCTECHNLGDVIQTPLAKQQGPDLIHISQRLRYDWIPAWVEDPEAVYPGTTMIDTNLTPEDIEAVRAFLWKTSTEAARKGAP
jgi:mono/diheme cytochrome c family protein